jgi:hypothetical protein
LLAEVSSLLADLGLSPALADTLRKLDPDHSDSTATRQTSRSSLTDCENGDSLPQERTPMIAVFERSP